MPDWLVDLALLGIVVGAVVFVYQDRVDDSAWEERWLALSHADRVRLAAAARRGTLLADSEDIDLAAGYARRERRRRGPATLRLVVVVAVGAALLIAGLVDDSVLPLAFGAVILLVNAWGFRRESQLAHNLRETASRDPHL